MITIVTLDDGGLCEVYVGAVQGSLSEEERRALAESLSAVYGERPEDDEDEEPRDLYFREVEVFADAASLRELVSCDDRGIGGVRRTSG